MDLDEVIKRISILRTRANLSARALSLTIGKNPSYINRLESKRNFEPSLSTLFSIIEVCNSSVEEFFYHNFDNYNVDMQTLMFLNTLSSYQKEAIMNLYRK